MYFDGYCGWRHILYVISAISVNTFSATNKLNKRLVIKKHQSVSWGTTVTVKDADAFIYG